MSNESILKKINALLNMTVENGAGESEANYAMEMAQRLMTEHMISESQLADHAKDKTCKRVTVPIFKTAYDTTPLNPFIADAFDSKNWWNRGKGEVYFFGYGQDAELAAYFYNYLNNAIVNESHKFRISLAFSEQKIRGYHTKTILSSFRKGMINRLCHRLDDLKDDRTHNVIKSTGTNLVVVKEEKVNSEYESLGLKLKTHKTNDEITVRGAYHAGKRAGDNVNMAGGIEGDAGAVARICSK